MKPTYLPLARKSTDKVSTGVLTAVDFMFKYLGEAWDGRFVMANFKA